MASNPVAPNGAILYRRLLRYAFPYWKYFLFSILAMGVVAATEAGFAAWLKPMIDSIFVDRQPETTKWIALGLVGIFIIRGTASFIAEYGMSWVGREVIQKLRMEMFTHLLQLPARYFDHSTTGKLVSKVTYDVEQVSRASTNAITILVRDSLTVLFLLGYMFWISGWLAMLFLGVGPVIGLLVRYISTRFRRISRNIQDSMGEVTQTAEEVIEGQRIVKSFGGQAYEAERFARINRRNFQQQMKQTITSALSVPVVQLVAACMLALVIYLAAMDTVVNTITEGAFVSFIAALLLLLPPLKRLTNVTQSIQAGVAAADSIFTLLDTATERDDGSLHIARAIGDIEYRNVSFRYGDDKAPVLQDISFTVASGETVALVGRSGSGKSTLVNLLARFYDPTSGSILLDGRDLHEYHLKDLRAQTAVVGQEVMLFNDTLERNIAYGFSAGADHEAIIEAARAAHALEFIEAMPEGLNTQVGERGVLLSGGQRQRIAIARALLKDAPVLILDEATSALDTESERAIQDALEVLMRNRTTLVIAHRLSTVEKADRILVLDGGRIVESGSHRELLAHEGHYAALHRMQFRDEVA